ncbi:MAG: hypothetical protein WCE44_02400 [Candidatus Velthaea sp.]|jgi:outer membrane biosynthesis protein TonB
MISTSWRPRTRRVLIAALILSVLIHFLGGALADYARRIPIVAHFLHQVPKAQKSDEFVATSDVIHLEKRTVPRPTRPNRPQPQPQRPSPRQPLVRPAIPALPQPKIEPDRPVARAETPRPVETARPELSHNVKKPAPAMPIVKSGGVPDASPVPHAEQAQRQAQRQPRNQLSPQQIAMLESQFAKTIQATRQDLPSAVESAKQPVGGPKRYPMNFQGIHDGLRRGQGYMDPVRAPLRLPGGYVSYVVHYIYMYPDGHIEEDVIPWPFIYPINDDPFARHDRFINMQVPPPDFRPDRPLKPQEESAYEYEQTIQQTLNK